jgi:hypothetical protein
MRDRPGATSTEVFEGATVVETVLEEVDDLLVGDVDYGGALVEEAAHVLAEGLALFLLHHSQVLASTRSAHGAREVAGELLLRLVPLVDRVLVQRLEPCERGLVQAEGEVEALGVVVAANALDGEAVALEALDGILLRVVLGDSQRFELVREEQVAKPRRESGEAVVVAGGGGLLPPQFFNLLAGVVAALLGSGGVAVRVVSTAGTALAADPPVGPMIGASAVAAAAGVTAAAVRVAVRDDLTIAVAAL